MSLRVSNQSVAPAWADPASGSGSVATQAARAGGGVPGLDSARIDQAIGAFRSQFARAASDPQKFHQTLKTAFGSTYDKVAAEGLRQRALRGDFSWMPKVKFATRAELSGANGAYDRSSGTVYLAADLRSNPRLAAATLTEEVGHHIDTLVNKSDAAGDEGELFRRILGGEQLSAAQVAELKAENDHGTITVDGKTVEAEFFLGKVWKGIKKAAKSVGNAVKGAVKGVANGVKAVANGVAGAVKGVANGVKKVASGIWNGVKSVAKGAIGVVKNVASKVWDGIKGVAGFIGKGLSGITSFLWKALGKVGGGVMNAIFKISDALSAVGKGIGSAFSKVRDSLTIGLYKAVTGIGSFISKIPVLGSIAKGIGSAIWTGINGLANGIHAVGSFIGNGVQSALTWVGGVVNRGIGLVTNPGWVLEGPRGWIGAAGRLLGF